MGIVGHIPSGPFELDGGRRDQPFELASAFLALGQGRIRELLDFLDALSALRTLVLVKRQFDLLAKTPLKYYIGTLQPRQSRAGIQLSVVIV